jgi:hypothetical protein
MKLPNIHTRRRAGGVARTLERQSQRAGSRVTLQAQQGVYECQMNCRLRYPRNRQEQLRCYIRECWS